MGVPLAPFTAKKIRTTDELRWTRIKRSPNSSSLPHVEVWIEINFNQGPSTWSCYRNMSNEVRKRISRKYCVGDSNRIEPG